MGSRLGIAAALAMTVTVGCALEDDGRLPSAWDGDEGEGGTDAAPPDEPLPDEPELPPTSEIYGGAPVDACGWPSAVSLGGSCSGTLVHPELVIYAAHCGSSYGSVRLGESAYGGAGRSVPTSYCKTYGGGGPGNGNDFAFCKLAQPVYDVPIVPVLMGCETHVLQSGVDVTLVGFGNANNGPYGIKREVTTDLNGISNSGEAHIGGGGKDTCQGDSGGPAFVQLDDGTWRVFGITSYGGACGGGGYYSMMHRGMSWFEQQSGLDLTPCHDADGSWNPGADCAGFPRDPASGYGGWANGCSGGPESGASTTCGLNDNDNGQQPPPMPPPVDEDCETCERYTSSLDKTGASDVQPDGNWYYSDSAGRHRAILTGPANADFDLYLYRWDGQAWKTVDSSTSATSNEEVLYDGSAGYYAWLVSSYSGAGSYELLIDRP
jgi:hypothetical protein